MHRSCDPAPLLPCTHILPCCPPACPRMPVFWERLPGARRSPALLCARLAQFPRHERTCLQCASSTIEDETHMVFHCPTYDHLRFDYADLFPLDLPPSIP